MPNFTAADTIRILISTDNHVGYNERDAIRGDDSWRSFHEVMCLAKERDVDMVLLAGDLFHENKPSRKSMYQVMRSLRMNCYGEKPCELQMLSDASENFAGAFNHVNYEDPDINVAIPVFSIHGNHDDPSGQGHLAALDLLQMSGLLNYYGRTPESDNILVKPVLLQKGNTKLALYGLSNVRDERLFRTFRDGNVKVFQPTAQKGDWFNLMSVHQNHHAYTETGYLPESFLPEFMDLVVWGHEHECLIDPVTNPEMGFKVMQPGSSVATSLVKGEAEAKHIAIASIRGKEFDIETIRLKTVRPFKYKEITLQDDKAMRDLAYAQDGAPKVHQYLMDIVNEMIEEAKEEWLELQLNDVTEDQEEEIEIPLPLIRLRIDYTPPEGGAYHLDNPQRFSNRFVGRVANQTDVVQFHRKRAASTRPTKHQPDMPDADAFAEMSLDRIKVEKLVSEFLTAQSLTILPQHTFSDAVGQYVDKDDKAAMGQFIKDSLESQVAAILEDGENDEVDDDQMVEVMEKVKEKIDKAFAKGELKRSKKKGSRKPKPTGWNSDVDGHWEDQAASIMRDDDEMEVDEEEEGDDSPTSQVASRRGRGRGRGAKSATTSTRKTAATKKAPAKSTAKSTGGRGRKKQVSEDEDEDEEEDDVIMLDDDDDDEEEYEEDEEESQGLFVSQAKVSKKKAPAATTSRSTTTKAAPAKAPAKTFTKGSTRGGKATSGPSRGQTTLSFASQANGSAAPRPTSSRAAAPKRLQEPSEDEISDDDAFEAPPPTATRNARTARR